MRYAEIALERKKGRKRAKRKTAFSGYYGYYWGNNDSSSDGGGDGGGESIEEGLGSKALVAALMAALATGPAQAEPSVAAQALGILRTINNFKHYDQQDLNAEAQLEINNVLRAIQGHPNQSKLFPIIKQIAQDPQPSDTQDLPPLTEPETK